MTKIEIVGRDDVTSWSKEDFEKIMEILRKKYDVKHLDVTAGGSVIGTLMWHKYPVLCVMTISLQHFCDF